ncbi:MAG: putative metal-binding motif-containing protein [Proteobacteria bacterium]|nr:putative metal-binding motif-containing protein [Pseudomonadota bacterium]
MNLSKKIILATSVCVAFLAVGIGCSVEERDIDHKGVFKCKEHADCLTGSQCVKAKESDPYGECIREKDIDHCRDNDGDGYYTETSPEYYNECGFSETVNPRDPDDGNPLIYPKATERCDGVDNSGDGCKDGVCPEGKDCTSDKSLCEDLITPCWGPGKYTEYENSACAARFIGVTVCIDGRLVHGIVKDGKIVEDTSGDKCPASPEELETKTSSNGDERYHQVSNADVEKGVGSDLKKDFDNNCDGVFDFKACTPEPTTKCFVTKGDSAEIQEGGDLSNYNLVVNKCGGDEANCPCLGTLICVGNSLVCGKGDTEITKTSVADKECSAAFD